MFIWCTHCIISPSFATENVTLYEPETQRSHYHSFLPFTPSLVFSLRTALIVHISPDRGHLIIPVSHILFWKTLCFFLTSSCPHSSSSGSRYTVCGRELWRLQWKLLMRALTAVLLQIQEAHLATHYGDPFREGTHSKEKVSIFDFVYPTSPHSQTRKLAVCLLKAHYYPSRSDSYKDFRICYLYWMRSDHHMNECINEHLVKQLKWGINRNRYCF